MTALQIAAIAWLGALVVVLVAQVRWLQRLVPDWLRNLSRVVLTLAAPWAPDADRAVWRAADGQRPGSPAQTGERAAAGPGPVVRSMLAFLEPLPQSCTRPS